MQPCKSPAVKAMSDPGTTPLEPLLLQKGIRRVRSSGQACSAQPRAISASVSGSAEDPQPSEHPGQPAPPQQKQKQKQQAALPLPFPCRAGPSRHRGHSRSAARLSEAEPMWQDPPDACSCSDDEDGPDQPAPAAKRRRSAGPAAPTAQPTAAAAGKPAEPDSEPPAPTPQQQQPSQQQLPLPPPPPQQQQQQQAGTDLAMALQHLKRSRSQSAFRPTSSKGGEPATSGGTSGGDGGGGDGGGITLSGRKKRIKYVQPLSASLAAELQTSEGNGGSVPGGSGGGGSSGGEEACGQLASLAAGSTPPDEAVAGNGGGSGDGMEGVSNTCGLQRAGSEQPAAQPLAARQTAAAGRVSATAPGPTARTSGGNGDGSSSGGARRGSGNGSGEGSNMPPPHSGQNNGGRCTNGGVTIEAGRAEPTAQQGSGGSSGTDRPHLNTSSQADSGYKPGQHHQQQAEQHAAQQQFNTARKQQQQRQQQQGPAQQGIAGRLASNAVDQQQQQQQQQRAAEAVAPAAAAAVAGEASAAAAAAAVAGPVAVPPPDPRLAYAAAHPRAPPSHALPPAPHPPPPAGETQPQAAQQHIAPRMAGASGPAAGTAAAAAAGSTAVAVAAAAAATAAPPPFNGGGPAAPSAPAGAAGVGLSLPNSAAPSPKVAPWLPSPPPSMGLRQQASGGTEHAAYTLSYMYQFYAQARDAFVGQMGEIMRSFHAMGQHQAQASAMQAADAQAIMRACNKAMEIINTFAPTCPTPQTQPPPAAAGAAAGTAPYGFPSFPGAAAAAFTGPTSAAAAAGMLPSQAMPSQALPMQQPSSAGTATAACTPVAGGPSSAQGAFSSQRDTPPLDSMLLHSASRASGGSRAAAAAAAGTGPLSARGMSRLGLGQGQPKSTAVTGNAGRLVASAAPTPESAPQLRMPPGAEAAVAAAMGRHPLAASAAAYGGYGLAAVSEGYAGAVAGGMGLPGFPAGPLPLPQQAQHAQQALVGMPGTNLAGTLLPGQAPPQVFGVASSPGMAPLLFPGSVSPAALPGPTGDPALALGLAGMPQLQGAALAHLLPHPAAMAAAAVPASLAYPQLPTAAAAAAAAAGGAMGPPGGLLPGAAGFGAPGV